MRHGALSISTNDVAGFLGYESLAHLPRGVHVYPPVLDRYGNFVFEIVGPDDILEVGGVEMCVTLTGSLSSRTSLSQAKAARELK